jgi:MFS family permease
MQCGLGIGFFIASFTWLFIAAMGPAAWRYMYVLGILPALVTLWIRSGIAESTLWERVNDKRQTALERQKSGAALSGEDQAMTRFTFVDLFVEPEIRRRTIIVFLMSLTTTLAWWGISTWVPQFVGSVAARNGLPGPQWASYAGICYTAGSIVGYASFGFLADGLGRKPVTAGYMALALAVTPVLFLWAQDLSLLLFLAFLNGTFSNGQYSWMPVWLPELFPTRMRATAIAFAFNAPRLIAFVGPLLTGQLIVYFGGFGHAASVISTIYILGLTVVWLLPETRGKTLPA